MRKIKSYKQFIIAYNKKEETYHIFTKEEWSYGNGFRYEEWNTDNLQECIDWIDCY